MTLLLSIPSLKLILKPPSIALLYHSTQILHNQEKHQRVQSVPFT